MPDRIFIRDLVIEGIHGLLTKEQHTPQRFKVGIEMRSHTHAGEDKIGATFDYGKAKKIAEGVVKGPHIGLIEVMAGRIAERILAEAAGALSEVSVTIEKLDIWKNGIPGVEVSLHWKG